MDRRKFIVNTCYSCLGASILGVIASGCSSYKSIKVQQTSGNLIVAKSEFYNEEAKTYYKYLVINNNHIKYPLGLVKVSEDIYESYLLQCTHKGAELSVYNEQFYCSSHGSEFNLKGEVLNGPAEKPLLKYPVITQDNNIIIKIK